MLLFPGAGNPLEEGDALHLPAVGGADEVRGLSGQGTEELDLEGATVVPGFIDAHVHYPKPMGAKVMLRDGRTTLLDLEIGTLGTKIDQWYKQRVNPLDDSQHDPKDYEKALNLAWREGDDKIPVGIFYQKQKPSFTDQIAALSDRPLVSGTFNPERLKSIFGNLISNMSL